MVAMRPDAENEIDAALKAGLRRHVALTLPHWARRRKCWPAPT